MLQAGARPRVDATLSRCVPRRRAIIVRRMWSRSWQLVAAAVLAAACFDGEYLAGTPCINNAECGPSLECVESVCGGPDSSAEPSAGGSSDGEASSGEPAGCAEGLVDCAGACVDTQRDQAHCGACGATCDGSCERGACVLDCGAEQLACDGECVNPASDYANCGGCGATCALEEVCAGGQCISSCELPEKLCGDGCVDISATLEHCGNCDSPCPEMPNSTAVSCVATQCLYECDVHYKPVQGGCSECSVDELLVDEPAHLWRLSELDGDVAHDEIGDADGVYVDGVVLDQDGFMTPSDRAARFGETLTSRVVVDGISFPAEEFTIEVVARVDELNLMPIFVSLASAEDKLEDGVWVTYSNEFTLYHYSGDEPGEPQGCA